MMLICDFFYCCVFICQYIWYDGTTQVFFSFHLYVYTCVRERERQTKSASDIHSFSLFFSYLPYHVSVWWYANEWRSKTKANHNKQCAIVSTACSDKTKHAAMKSVLCPIYCCESSYHTHLVVFVCV